MYSNSNNSKSNKSNKFGSILIIVLLLILSLLIFKIYKNIKASYPTLTKQDIIIKNNTKQDIEVWNEKVANLQNKINQTNKLLVLEGSTDILVTYDNKEFDGADNMLAWMKNKLASLGSKTITIDTTYKFGYSYDLVDLPIENTDNKIHIKLYQNRLRLQYVEEDTDKTIISSEKGIFAKQFTPQQVNAIMGRVKIHTQNNIINNSEIRDKAIENAEGDILGMANGFGIDKDNIEIEVISDGLLDNNEIEATNIIYKNN